MTKQTKPRKVNDKIVTLDGIISPAKESPRGHEMSFSSTRISEQNNRNFTDNQYTLNFGWTRLYSNQN